MKHARALMRVVIVLLGAGSFYYYTHAVGFGVVGALIGFLLGGLKVRAVRSGAQEPGRLPNAHLSLILSGGAWLLVLGLGGWALNAGYLLGEGGGLVLILILPLITVLWLVGGSMSSGAGHNALIQIQSRTRPESDRPLAETGLFLSRVLTVALLSFLFFLVVCMLG